MTIVRLLTCVLLVFLVGCDKQVLHSKLSEGEANEIVARLYSSDLRGEKVSENDGSFRVDIDQSSFSAAVAVLQAHGLPRERFQSLGDVFEKDGFISSPLEERARLNYALSQEISKTISNIDGVILARVHLAVPKREHLAKSVAPSSASVFVKHRASNDLADSVGKIKSMVVTGFENLPYENVTVSLFPTEPPLKPVDKKPMESILASFDSGTLSMFKVLVSVALLLLLLGAFSIFRSSLLTRARRQDHE
jgi:type III secretion protein J